MRPSQVFLLSPASCGGQRAKLLFDPRTDFPLATRLRQPEGAPLGEVFAFLSGLYFRGKLAYARQFAQADESIDSVSVITTNRGLVPPERPVVLDDLHDFATVDIDGRDERYRTPLERDARALDRAISAHTRVVLLGSIATGKYVDALLAVFGERLVFPAAFVGRGDMSRGGLLLRRTREDRELEYVSVAGAERHGPRPPKLSPAR
jgi:hypothetical protein